MCPGPALRIRAGERAGSSYLGPAGGHQVAPFPSFISRSSAQSQASSSPSWPPTASHPRPTVGKYSTIHCHAWHPHLRPAIKQHAVASSPTTLHHTEATRAPCLSMSRLVHHRDVCIINDSRANTVISPAPRRSRMSSSVRVPPSQGLPRPVDARLATATISSPSRAPPLETSAYLPVDTLWFLTRERR